MSQRALHKRMDVRPQAVRMTRARLIEQARLLAEARLRDEQTERDLWEMFEEVEREEREEREAREALGDAGVSHEELFGESET